ncbi:MAG TPA: GNAT family N-acetyltransferase [Burkholderiales bacterium]|nr:GNAT family N-acetyltransferase [Burkholderiales bacterium]
MPAVLADAVAVAEMSRDLIETGLGWSWSRYRVTRAISDPETLALTARHRGSLVGFGIMEFGDEKAHLSLLAVKPGYQREGIGTRVFEWLKLSALTAGIAIVKLELRANNVVAQNFYRSLGFEEAGWAVGYYRGRETALRMALHLRRQSAGRSHQAL